MFSTGGFDDMADDAGELARRAGTGLEEDLLALGLFVNNKSVVAQTSTNGQATVAIMINTIIGRVAFSDQVQRPEQEATDERFHALVDRDLDDEYERRLRELRGDD